MNERKTPLSHPLGKIVCALGILGPLALLGALGRAQEKAAPSGKPQTSAQKFKNIKVFKNLPADQLIPVMHKFNDSLGVRCDFCHVIKADHSGWESDEKPAKNMARQMVLLTNDLNAHKKVLNKSATCFMCHHGHPEPENQAPQAPPPGNR